MVLRIGMWGWILLLISAAFAAPDSVSKSENEPVIGTRNPERSIYSPMRWLNPLKWMFSTSKEQTTEALSGVTTYMEPMELAEYYGYVIENHTVTTEDGYILTLHRLPGGRIHNGAINKQTDAEVKARPVALLHHAYMTSSREFMILGPQKALAFLLSDAGYDVWLCNARGNTYSLSHVSLSPKSEEFWDFSIHEHGYYDLPAVINYVQSATGKEKMHYLGHSMGTIAFFTMASTRPEMMSKITSFTAMGPLTTPGRCRSLFLKFILRTAPLALAAMRRVGIYALMPHYRVFTAIGQTICHNGRMTQGLCLGFLGALSGRSSLMSPKLLPEMLAHAPAGTSIRTLEHFSQTYRSGFRQFDYGPNENMKRYNTKVPPSYNLKATNVPTQIYYGMNDMMADFTEAEMICKSLPQVFNCEAVSDKKFTHLDFIWADNVHILLYKKVLEGIKPYDDPSLMTIPNGTLPLRC